MAWLIYGAAGRRQASLLDLDAEGVPLVIQGTPDVGDLPSVDVDNIASARMATEYLIQLGHRRIGMITNGPLTYTSSRDRLTGYVQALEAAGLPIDEGLIQSGEFSDDSGVQAMKRLLELPHRPTAAFVASDVVALGAIRTIREHGLCIPDDMSIVGFDDIPLAQYLEPGLTTVRLPRVELGLQAGKMLMDLVEGKPVPERHLRLNTSLIIRGSAASFE
jgi:DNA-binding LacI/PurR family transcriptional regulator